MSKKKVALKKNVKQYLIQALIAIFFLLIAVFCLIIYNIKSKQNNITYAENSDATYKVYINENNDYYDEDYIDMNNRYIASLIKNIKANLSYNLKVNSKVTDYEYSYKIISDVKVIDKQDRDVIYSKENELYLSPLQKSKNEINIVKELEIDYNQYNNSISEFVKLYDLDETNCTVNIIMYVTVKNDNNTIINNKVVELSIPLTTKTIAISVNKSVKNNEINKLLIDENNEYDYLLYIAITTFILSILFSLVIYILIQKRKSPERIYRSRIKKILRKFGSSIQIAKKDSITIDPELVIKIETFEDMLEISEVEQKALILIENEEKTGAFFLILADENKIFAYHYSVNDIYMEKYGENFFEDENEEINDGVYSQLNKNKKFRLSDIEEIK